LSSGSSPLSWFRFTYVPSCRCPLMRHRRPYVRRNRLVSKSAYRLRDGRTPSPRSEINEAVTVGTLTCGDPRADDRLLRSRAVTFPKSTTSAITEREHFLSRGSPVCRG
jgi:hypothetical protein